MLGVFIQQGYFIHPSGGPNGCADAVRSAARVHPTPAAAHAADVGRRRATGSASTATASKAQYRL